MQSSNINLMRDDMKTGRRAFFFQYLLLFVVLIFSIYQYSVHRLYGFSVYPDEFGYWASAAQWIGYDWSDVASLGYYYSFGYSLLLAPILMLFHDSIKAYRAAVFVNMILQCISVGMLWGIFNRIFRRPACDMEYDAEKERIKKMQLVFAVGTAVFYPAWTFYVQMTLAEALLTFLYVFICHQFILLLDDTKTINVTGRILLLSIAFLYLHFVHMRTVGVAAAAVLVLGFYLWRNPTYRKWIVLLGAVLAVGVIIGFRMKEQVIDTGKIRDIIAILSPQGIKQFLQSCAGKLYYLGMASFGLFFPAVGICAKKTFILLRGIFKRKNDIRREDWFYGFLLLSMMGQFLVSALYANGAYRLDSIIYGRYNDYFLPLFMGIGVLVLLNDKNPWKIFLYNTIISSVLFVITLRTALHSESRVMRGVFATGLNYLSESVYSYQVVPEFIKAYIFGIFLMFLLTGSICIGRRFRQIVFPVAFVLLMEILLTICLCRKYTWSYNDSDYYDLKVYEWITDYEAQNGDVPVRYLYGGGTNYIDLIQFAMRDKKIEIIWEKDSPDDENGQEISQEIREPGFSEPAFLIADYNSPYLPELEEKYMKCVESNSFVLFFIL